MPRLLPLFVPLAMLAGCAAAVDQSQLVGTWEGSAGMTYKTMQENADGGSEQATFIAEQESNGRTLSLELKADGTAIFSYNEPVEGTWSLSDGVVTLVLPKRTTSAGGPGFGGTYLLKVEGAGTLTGPDPNMEGVPVTFSK